MLVYEPYGRIDFFERTTLVILYTDRVLEINNTQSDAADLNANQHEHSESASAVNGFNITIQIRFFYDNNSSTLVAYERESPFFEE